MKGDASLLLIMGILIILGGLLIHGHEECQEDAYNRGYNQAKQDLHDEFEQLEVTKDSMIRENIALMREYQNAAFIISNDIVNKLPRAERRVLYIQLIEATKHNTALLQEYKRIAEAKTNNVSPSPTGDIEYSNTNKTITYLSLK